MVVLGKNQEYYLAYLRKKRGEKQEDEEVLEPRKSLVILYNDRNSNYNGHNLSNTKSNKLYLIKTK